MEIQPKDLFIGNEYFICYLEAGKISRLNSVIKPQKVRYVSNTELVSGNKNILPRRFRYSLYYLNFFDNLQECQRCFDDLKRKEVERLEESIRSLDSLIEKVQML